MADPIEAAGADTGDEHFAMVGSEVGESVLGEGAVGEGIEASEPILFGHVEAMGFATGGAGDGDADEVDVGGVGCEVSVHGVPFGE
jgi:hypothetical protein